MNGARASGLSSDVAALTVAGLTVTVDGSNVTSRVDNAGRFVLNNVPPGDVHLRFTGNGVDANLGISAVRNGDQINITVTISGNGATLDRMTRQGEQENEDNDDADDENELEGTISAGNCASFTLNGLTVTTNASTVFRGGSCADIKAGAKVEVEGVRTGTTVVARRVEFEENEVELEGTVSAGTCSSFTLNGTTVATNASTVFRTGSCSDIKAGIKVEVKGVRSGSGVLATRIDVKGLQNNEVEIEGRVTAATGCSSFTVNGTVITTNSATQFRDGSCADIKPNVKVEVKGTRTGTNAVLATRVEIDK